MNPFRRMYMVGPFIQEKDRLPGGRLAPCAQPRTRIIDASEKNSHTGGRAADVMSEEDGLDPLGQLNLFKLPL